MSRSADTSALRSAGRVALVHDFLIDLRGGERVFRAICDLFPDADVFSPIHDPVGTRGAFDGRAVRTSYLNRLHPTAANFRLLLPFYPRAIESLDLSGYDLILSSSSAWAHGVIAHEGQRHLSYCHNPFRYAWDQREEALAGRSSASAAVLCRILGRWRAWDRTVSSEVDSYVANGAVTRERIARCFGRSSSILHPPVDVGRFRPGAGGEAFAVLSELMPHKRIDVIVEAFAEADRALTVIGDGPDLERLRALAGPRTEFAGRLTDEEVASVLAGSAGLVQCATEEFGLASVEAQAAGRPVLALAAGGALETVVPGLTGAHFTDPTVESLGRALTEFDPASFEPSACRENAERFSRGAFAVGLACEIERLEEIAAAPRERARQRRRGLWRSQLP